MITWFDMPAEGLSNGGLFEVKELEVTENGTYETKGEMYNKVTVNVEGGGSSWQTVFEGSVTTEEFPGGNVADLPVSISADTIKVTFNGTEYTCEALKNGNWAFYGGFNPENPIEADFSEYPFYIVMNPDEQIIKTESIGTYTLKIEEPQGGGSSDFSTAEVTFSGTDGTLATMPLIINTPFDAILPLQNEVNDETYTIALYKGKAIISLSLEGLGQTVTPSGDIEWLESETYLVTGNGTITIS